MNGWNEKALCLWVITFFINYSLNAQLSYSVDSVGIEITGGSTLHDWKVKASEITDYPSQIVFDENEHRRIDEFQFKVKVASMDGGRGAAMNKKIFKALKSDTHPNIEFALSKPVTQGEGGIFQAEGLLTIAGHSENISLDILIEEIEKGVIFSGSQPIKMSDFGIDPPSAMFGQIQTEDDIQVHFAFKYKKG